MHKHGRSRRVVLSIAALAALVSVGLALAPAALAQSQPGFDGTTIKIAGFGLKSVLPSLEDGARARVKQFNDNKELKGIKLDYVEFADDKTDSATALSEVRRLVTQDQVFALVPDSSLVAPGQYITQQKVPTFGSSFGPEYCTTKPSKAVWIFGAWGCQTSNQPAVTRDAEAQALKYVQEASGKQKPTVALITADDATGVLASKVLGAEFEQNGGWGKLVYNKASIPNPAPGDLSPFAQALLTSNDGSAPDLIRCAAGNPCIPLYSLLRAQGFKGEYEHELYTDLLVKPFAGSVTSQSFRNVTTQNPGYDKLRAAVEASKPGTKVDVGVMYGYLSTDMFIQALKLAAKNGKSGITRQNVQKAASTMTWEVPGVAGPTKYPASTVTPTPMCREVMKSNGTSWETVEPFACNMKAYKLK
jgi:ABC-type branched-subunit amino acid transport system substrate-binding protein